MSETGDPQAVLLDWPAPAVARLRINRANKRNAIDQSVRLALTDALQALAAEGQARALVFGGVGGTFSAGGDLPSMVGLSEAQARERMQQVRRLCLLVAGLRFPVVSAIEGFGAGAAVGLALLGDRIVVGPGTKLLFPFLKLGLTPDWGQVLTLPRRVGTAAASRILCAGAAVGGGEAHRIGLADALVPDADVMAHAVEQATVLAALPLDAFARMKARLHSPSASLEQELAREVDDQAVCMTNSDFREGYAAFQEKRAPNFARGAALTPAPSRGEREQGGLADPGP
jgi:enoyl-CoA hydratase/carnithine racemase